MPVKIRLLRVGKKKQPYYRVVVADSRSPRDGRIIERLGRYSPLDEPSLVDFDEDRALHWLRNGAQPTEAIQKILETSGVWDQFKAERPKAETAARKAIEHHKAHHQAALAARPAEPEPEPEPEPAAEESAAEAPAVEEPAEEPAEGQTEPAAEEQAESAAEEQADDQVEASSDEASSDEASSDEAEADAGAAEDEEQTSE